MKYTCKLPFSYAGTFNKTIFLSMHLLLSLSLYAPITQDEYNAWFYLYGLRLAVQNGKGAKLQNYMSFLPHLSLSYTYTLLLGVEISLFFSHSLLSFFPH